MPFAASSWVQSEVRCNDWPCLPAKLTGMTGSEGVAELNLQGIYHWWTHICWHDALRHRLRLFLPGLGSWLQSDRDCEGVFSHKALCLTIFDELVISPVVYGFTKFVLSICDEGNTCRKDDGQFHFIANSYSHGQTNGDMYCLCDWAVISMLWTN